VEQGFEISSLQEACEGTCQGRRRFSGEGKKKGGWKIAHGCMISTVLMQKGPGGSPENLKGRVIPKKITSPKK